MGVHLQVSTVDGTTPLHAAASSGQSDVVRVLLGVGADASAKNKVCVLFVLEQGMSVQHIASFCCSLCADGICLPLHLRLLGSALPCLAGFVYFLCTRRLASRIMRILP